MRISESGTIEVIPHERLTIHISTSASPCRAKLFGCAWTIPPRHTDNLLLAQITPDHDTQFTASFASGKYRLTIRGNPSEETFTEQINAPGSVSRTYAFVTRT